MSDFGFDTFDFNDSTSEMDSLNDPFGVARRAREKQWWNSQPGKGPRGGGSSTQLKAPWTAGPDPIEPNPSTTQRVILDAKNKDEGYGKLLEGLPGPDTGAGPKDAWGRPMDFDLHGGGVMLPADATDLNGGGVRRYSAPDPTNPGQQDQAKAATVDNPAVARYYDLQRKKQQLIDSAMALPARTGITWGGAGTGSIEMKRNKYLADADIAEREMGFLRAANPAAFNGGGIPEEWKSGPGSADWIYERGSGRIKEGPAPTPRTGNGARGGSGASLDDIVSGPPVADAEGNLYSRNKQGDAVPMTKKIPLPGPEPDGSEPGRFIREPIKAAPKPIRDKSKGTGRSTAMTDAQYQTAKAKIDAAMDAEVKKLTPPNDTAARDAASQDPATRQRGVKVLNARKDAEKAIEAKRRQRIAEIGKRPEAAAPAPTDKGERVTLKDGTSGTRYKEADGTWSFEPD